MPPIKCNVMSHYAAQQFAEEFNVSRETMARFTRYAALLGQWQQKINLVGPSTLPDIWARHMADSAQIFALAKAEKAATGCAGGIWLDLGSGAGFPGMVVALLLMAEKPIGKVHLVEADQRKAGFLRHVIAETQAPAVLHIMRIEDLAAQNLSALKNVDFISARALAALPETLGYVADFCNSSTIAWLHKGRGWQEELTAAQELWKLQVQDFVSCTDKAARILAISQPMRKPPKSQWRTD